MRRLALRIAYDGTAYAGWQRQESGLAVQAVIEDTFHRVFSEKVHVMGSGRTDAGVHARGQVAAVDLEHPIPPERLLMALNSNLPEDIRILEVAETFPDENGKLFQPQYSAKKKTYVYRFCDGTVMMPELRWNTVYVKTGRRRLDADRMRQSLQALEGEHDFIAFRSANAENSTTVRTIYRVDLKEVKGSCEEESRSLYGSGTLYELRVTGNGFLYNMVRIIAGTAIWVGLGKLETDCMERALQTGERTLLGATAPAWGLTLESVEYTPDPFNHGN